MEKDTVLLNIEEYNELRDFKKWIEENKSIFVVTGWENDYDKTIFTTEEAVMEVAKYNKLIQKENDRLHKKLHDMNKPKEITIDDIKKMSYWQFRKWRKS